MGQRADEVRQFRSGTTPAHDPAAIRSRIEQTRLHMSETIDAIEHRLSPAHIKQQLRTAAIDGAKGASSNMLKAIKQNPIPAAIAGLSIGWLVRKGGGAQDDRRQYEPYYRAYEPGMQHEPYYQSYQPSGQRESGGAMSESMHMAQERAGEMMGQARDTAGEMMGQARHTARGMGETMEGMGHQVSTYGSEMRRQVQHTSHQVRGKMHESPLAMGAVALAVGTAVGLMLPQSQMEHQMMGDTRDRMMDRAEDMAQQTMDKVEHVAEETQRSVGEEARKQGLMQ